MSLVVTSPLQKSLPALTSSLSAQEWGKIVTDFIEQRQSETVSLIARLDANIIILENQKERTSHLIGVLEEAGGLTVRARNLMSTPDDISKYQKQIKEFQDWFVLARAKFDNLSKESTYQGINLMNGDRLETFFDAKGHNKLVTEGIALNCTELGIREPDFSTLFTVQNARIDVMNAIDIVVTVRNTISAHISDLTISRDFAIHATEMARESYAGLKSSNLVSEMSGLKKLSDLGDKILGDEPMADPAQQEILKSFAASPLLDPNMEDI